jgi:hypothetical protein
VLKRNWWALLVLAAVFAMHGLQCMAGGSGMDRGHAPASLVQPAGLLIDDLSVQRDTGPSTTARAFGPERLGAHGDPAPVASTSSYPTGSLDHLWTVCLAVLSAGLAVLLIVLVHALTAGRLPALHPDVRPWPPALHPLRPPDPFFLCVLRN